MRTVLAIFAIIFALVASASELELSNTDVEPAVAVIGESQFGGSFGGATLTSGSFVMMASSGGFEEVKLGASPTQASAATFSDATFDNGSFDWTQCTSEGGSKNCATCDTGGGVLPCSKVAMDTDWYKEYSSACPDGPPVATNLKYFFQSGEKATGGCLGFADNRAAYMATSYTTFKFPTLGSSLVLTKGFVKHPHKSNLNIGMFGLKRLVRHRCAGTKCRQGEDVGDVAKWAWCIKCDTNVFASTDGDAATDAEKGNFMKTCVPKAINSDGSIKTAFRCSGTDGTHYEAALLGV